MTTTDDRQSRTTPDLLPFLPLVLIIIMFGMAVLIAQVAPSQVTSGVYQVIVGEGQAQFRLTTESLTCSRTGDTATCTAPVAERELTIDVKYGDPASVCGHTCTARHGDRPVPCMPQLNYGHASASARISDSLGVTEPELIRLRDAVPWWRTGNESSLAAIALLCMLAATAGVTTHLSIPANGGTHYLIAVVLRTLTTPRRASLASQREADPYTTANAIPCR